MILVGIYEPFRSTGWTIAAIEAGKYSPSLESAFRIADAFGVRLDDVFQWVRDRKA